MSIREIRKRRGLTLTEAAAQMQRSAAWLSRIERGAVNKVSRDEIEVLSTWAGCPVSADAIMALDGEQGLNNCPTCGDAA